MAEASEKVAADQPENPGRMSRAEVWRRLRAPVNGRYSSEIEIISSPKWERLRRERAANAMREVAIARQVAALVKQAAPACEQVSTPEEAPIRIKVTINRILSAVGDYYKIPLVDLLSERRKAPITRARHVAMYLARNLTAKSYPQIGLFIGGRDHTTVLNAIHRVEERLADEPGLAVELEQIKGALGA